MAGVALTVLSAHGGPLALTFGAADFDCPFGMRVEQRPLQWLSALRRAVQRRWRRCAALSQALAVAAGVQYWATILCPNELDDAWLLLYEARGTRPPFCFRTH